MLHPPNFYRNRSNHLILNTSLTGRHFPSRERENVEVPRTKIAGVFTEFCAKSTIHGVAHLNDRNRHMIERVWWIVAIVLSLVLCTVFIYNASSKWSNDRVIVRMDNKLRSIGDIPFPVVTICPMIKTATNKFNYTDVYRAMLKLDGNESRTVTAEELEIMGLAVQQCEQEPDEKILKLFPNMYLNESVYQTMRKILPKFEETIFQCKFMDKWRNCTDIMVHSLTEKGLCYSFNTINLPEYLTNEQSIDFSKLKYNQPSSNWNSDHGYEVPENEEPYPYHVHGTGLQFSLIVILRVNKLDIDYLCGGSVQGFKILFHPPNENPNALKKVFYLSPGKTSFYRIQPNVILTSDQLKKFDSNVRRCFLRTERKLRFFKYYTQRNCQIECLSNFTLAQCGCVQFSMMHTKDAKVCGPLKMQCYRWAEIDFYRQDDLDRCNCLPSCTTLAYQGYQTTGDYDLVRFFSKSDSEKRLNLDNATFSRLIVSFNDETFIAMIRTELHSLNDYIATFGGLFNLFIGASLLSVLELIYYSTIRIYYAYKSRRSRPMINQQRLFLS